MRAGNDGRPDWMARKNCNYLTATAEECPKFLLGSCSTEVELIAVKDAQIHGVINQMERSTTGWDSMKCPPIRFSFYSSLIF